MQYPLVFRLGEWSLHAHAVFEVLAYTLGYRLYLWLRRRQGDAISDENRTWIFIGAAAGAFLGSHTLGMLERPPDPGMPLWLQWMGNKTIVGGFLGGLFGVEFTKKILHIRRSSGDLMVFPLLTGLITGRLGCHLAGLTDSTHGLPSALPWAIDFGDGIYRHPVNLYEMLWALCTGIALYIVSRHRPLRDGMQFKLFMVAYLIWRFFAEWLKPVWMWPFELSSIQVACLIGLGYYGVLGVRGGLKLFDVV